MRNLVDTIFGPFLAWLDSIISKINSLSVPLARPLNLSRYFGYFDMLGPHWKTFITTLCVLSFIYLVTYIIVANLGLIMKFKNAIKWW
jgi:hypothetical protein